jgi:hypothetical protein
MTQGDVLQADGGGTAEESTEKRPGAEHGIITVPHGKDERMGSDSTEAVAPPPAKSESRHPEF